MADDRRIITNMHLTCLEVNTDEYGNEYSIIDSEIKKKLGTKYNHSVHSLQWRDAWSSLVNTELDWNKRTSTAWNNAYELYKNYLTVTSTPKALDLGISTNYAGGSMSTQDVSMFFCRNIGDKPVYISLINDSDYTSIVKPGEAVILAAGTTVEIPEVRVKTGYAGHTSKIEYLIPRA